MVQMVTSHIQAGDDHNSIVIIKDGGIPLQKITGPLSHLRGHGHDAPLYLLYE